MSATIHPDDDQRPLTPAETQAYLALRQAADDLRNPPSGDNLRELLESVLDALRDSFQTYVQSLPPDVSPCPAMVDAYNSILVLMMRISGQSLTSAA
jgi:hypothetical protein